MEENEVEVVKKENGRSILKLDLSYKKLAYIDTNILISTNITELYVSNNTLNEVPAIILNLNNIRVLDLSFNNIEYFDDTPNFCHTVEYLNIANNKLLGPPYWIWAENPNKLIEINLSSNICITQAFEDSYFEELLQYKSLVRNIIIYNCRLKRCSKLLGCFRNARLLEFGTSNLDKVCNANRTDEVLWKVIENCCDIEIINLSNTSVFDIDCNIGMYKKLREIDLSFNQISKLPEEFCDLASLEVCILSHNYIMYLPDGFYNLNKLMTLFIDNNELCMLHAYIYKLPNLVKLDIYNNYLHEKPDRMEKFLEIDLAMNYFEEPNDEEYLGKKLKLRTNHKERYDGRKELKDIPDSEHSDDLTDDELVIESPSKDLENRPLSSPEDWDSDEYWVPHISPKYEPPQSPWIFFVKQKMTEGNFCPIDAHIIPISDQVKYEKLCNPTVDNEVEGQFDDLSDDSS